MATGVKLPPGFQLEGGNSPKLPPGFTLEGSDSSGEIQKPKNNIFTGALETAISGPSGMPSREPVETASEAIDMFGGGVPRSTMRYPKEFLFGGAPAVQTMDAARRINEGGFGVGGPAGLAEKVFDKREDKPEAFKTTGLEERLLPSPKGATAQVAGTALGMAGDAFMARPSNPKRFGEKFSKMRKGTKEIQVLSEELMSGADKARKNVGAKYEDYIKNFGDKEVDGAKVTELIGNLPKGVIEELRGNPNIERGADGVIKANLRNLKAIRDIVRGEVSSKHWNPKIVDEQSQKAADFVYDEIGGVMREGNEPLAGIMKDYSQAKSGIKEIRPALKTPSGYTKTRPVMKMFGKGAEGAKQQAIEKLAEFNPEIYQTVSKIKSMADNAKRAETIKKALFGLGAASGLGAAGRFGYEIINP